MEQYFSNELLLKDNARELTGEDFKTQVSGLSEAFRKSDIRKGQLVALQMEPGIDYALAIFGLANLGAIPVLVPTRLKEPQIQKILSDNQISVRVTKLPLFGVSKNTFCDLSEQQIILLTSGTSTDPKMAVLTFDNFIQNAIGSNANLPFGPGDKWLMNLPLYHVGGLSILFRALVGGGCAYFSTLTDANVTHVSMVHTQLYRFLKSPHQTYFKAILLGGSAFPNTLINQALKMGLPLYRSYGMTEMASQVTATKVNEDLDSSGQLLEGRELKIENGEILVKGKTLFKGFFKNGTVQNAFDPDGWYSTRDLGHLKDDGSLVVSGRKDRMFICGGENIQPEFIEKVLLDFPGISQTRVTAQSDPEYGYVPVAYIEIDKLENISKDLIRFLEDRLSGFQIPRTFLPFSELSAISLKDMI